MDAGLREDRSSDSDPEASTSSLPLDESVSTLQPPSSPRKKHRSSRGNSSNSSQAGSSEANSPQTSFLSRFISSFRSSDRPTLSRSLSSPQDLPTASTSPPLSPTTASTGRFRPPFSRRGRSDASTSTQSPTTSPKVERPNPYESAPSNKHIRPDRSVDMVKRGSVASQRTVQPRKASHTISPLASPTLPSPLAHSHVPDPLDMHQPRVENELQRAMSILAELVPPALLLLAYIGPNHLFAPPLSAAIGEAMAATSPVSTNPYGSTSSTSAVSVDSVSSSSASVSSLPTMLNATAVAPTHTHELHSPTSLPLPAVTACSLWKVLKGLEWLTKPDGVDACSPDLGDFDFPSLVQAAVDFLAAEASGKRVEILLGQVGNGGSSSPVSAANAQLQGSEAAHVETRELLVSGDERQWMIAVVLVLRQVLSTAGFGSTIEVRFSARQTSHGVVRGDKVVAGDSQDTYVPTRASLRKHWTVMLDIAVFDNANSPGHLATPLTPNASNAPFQTDSTKRLLSDMDVQIVPQVVEDAVGAWRLETSMPGALLSANETPSELLGKRRASLETSNREPTMEDLKRFAETTLKGLRVSLHASEYSVFAKHMATFLANWGLEVTYIPIDKDDDALSNAGSASGADTYWNRGRREPVSRLDSGFASAGVEGSAYEPANSPLRAASVSSDHSTAEVGPTGAVIVDDDVPTLRRLLFALKPPVIHAAPLLSKRPQLATRRTRSSPHVRQLHHSAQPTPGWPIIFFTSLSNFKAVKEAIAETIAVSKTGAVPDVIVVPKPAGPRRCITALWTALKKPTVDPSLPPIATAPAVPGGQLWLPRLSPALSNHGQDFDSAAAEAMTRSESGSKPRTPPAPSQPVVPIAPYPPSPLSKVSDEQASYFTDVAESMDGVSPSEGMVVQSPDGRPAIFFQPSRVKAHRSSSSRQSKGKPRRSDGDASKKNESPDSPRQPQHQQQQQQQQQVVGAPHEIGLGPQRRHSGSTASSPGDGPNVPLATPALSLDAFINFAAKRNEGEGEGEAPQLPAAAPPTRQDSTLSRHTSSSSAQSGPASQHSSRAGSERASKNASPRPSVLGHARRVSHASSPPSSPQVVDPTPSAGVASSSNTTSKGTSTNITPGTGPRRKSKRKNSLLPTVPPINVLIVEDNPINQTILSMFMKKKGIKYAVAKDGEEAVQKWKNGDFHLVLMDIQLPVKDGITATREIREMEKQRNVGTFVTTPNSDNAPTPSSASTSPSPMTPISPLLSMPVIIVALTASSLNEDRVTALAAGCNDFLTKPVSLPWLQQKLLEWGSMAYLSGFSKRLRSPSLNTSRPTPTAGFKASAALQAQNVSEHLHIDPHRSHAAHKAQSEAEGAPPQTGPQLSITSPTPEATPANAQASAKAKDVKTEAKHEAVAAEKEPGPDLDAVDAKLSDLRLQADNSVGATGTEGGKSPARPPPVPLVRKGSPPESQPSLESILSEGSRLTRAGQARHSESSFSQVMTDSFTEPEA